MEHSTQQQQNTLFFSRSHGTCLKIDHILSHETNLSKLKRIIQSIFSNHDGIKLEIINRKITEKPLNTWKLNNTLLNKPWIKEEDSKQILNVIELN